MSLQHLTNEGRAERKPTLELELERGLFRLTLEESFLSDWNYREDRKNKIEDWSGRKIWENDILRYSYDYDGSPFLKDGEEIKYRVGAVFWSEWRGSWAVCGRGNKKYTNNDVFKYNRNPNRTEVIGNIFDNPELLEVE